MSERLDGGGTGGGLHVRALRGLGADAQASAARLVIRWTAEHAWTAEDTRVVLEALGLDLRSV